VYVHSRHGFYCAGIKFGSVANYLNGLVNVLVFVATLPSLMDGEEIVDDRLESLLAAVSNLQTQAEREAKEQRLYRLRKPDWISWGTAKLARESALLAMELALKKRPANRTKQLICVSEALVICLLTIHPPDRCGVIRRLCVDETLKRREDGTGFYIDLTKFKHKTSRFYGVPRIQSDALTVGNRA
jgi:hypothetical protein